jgi:acyl-CoA thioesterase I
MCYARMGISGKSSGLPGPEASSRIVICGEDGNLRCMSHVLFFFAGGEGFWWILPPLILMLFIAIGAPRLRAGPRVCVDLGLVMAAAAVFLAGPPVPPWIYAVWLAAVGLLIAALQPRWAGRLWPPRLGASVVAIFVLSLAMHEWPYRQPKSLAFLAERQVYVLGDSLSAGIAAEEKTWPQILEEGRGWRVENLAVAGAQLRDAARHQAPRVTGERAAVILLIGGNDLVKRVAPAAFAHDLEELLEELAAPNRLLVMVELPTIPGYRVYLRLQRQAAQQHEVVLIPRRYLAQVFMTPEATVDGLQLSDLGHQRWAESLHLLTGGP